MKKIGLLGGTFDPIHHGHLRSALDAKLVLELDEVRFIPCHIPPHKSGENISDSEQRKQMVELAIADQSAFSLDARELAKDSPSYTFETLQSIRAEHKEDQLFFIMGMDSLLSLHTWHRWQELLDYAHLVVTKRPGNQVATANPEVSQLIADKSNNSLNTDQSGIGGIRTNNKFGEIFILETPELEISSTDIRRFIQNKKSCQYLLPQTVETFILEQKLYQTGDALPYDNI